MNMVLDTLFGLFIAYVLFRIVDHYAEIYNIEELKSGVYMDESVSLLKHEGEQEDDPE